LEDFITVWNIYNRFGYVGNRFAGTVSVERDDSEIGRSEVISSDGGASSGIWFGFRDYWGEAHRYLGFLRTSIDDLMHCPVQAKGLISVGRQTDAREIVQCPLVP
jgi:hypothetical protein